MKTTASANQATKETIKANGKTKKKSKHGKKIKVDTIEMSSDWGFGTKKFLQAKKPNPSCCSTMLHTKKDGNQWIKFNMEKEAYVNMVKIMNRSDCCSKRIDGHEVWVGGSNGEHKCGTLFKKNESKKKWIKLLCPWSALGNYVMVKKPSTLSPKATGKAEYLQIAGIRIRGEK